MTIRSDEGLTPRAAALAVGMNLDRAYFRFSHLEAIRSEMERSLESSRGRGRPRHLVIMGETGSGKSRLIARFCAEHPPQPQEDRTLLPVLVVRIPARPTARKLTRTLLDAVGSPFASRGEDTAQVQHLKRMIDELGVRLIICDEVSHLVDRGREKTHYAVGDVLKETVDQLGVPWVLCGIPRMARLFDVNEQLRGRFARRCTIRPFDMATAESTVAFRSAVGAFERLLAPFQTVGLTSMDVLPRLLAASNGLLRPLVDVLKSAVEVAADRGDMGVDLPALEAGFRAALWEDAPSSRNPFHSRFDSLPLIQRGEPFARPERDIN